jgi:hypothetical protein
MAAGKTCSACNGSGMVYGKDGQTPALCPLCDGSGAEFNPGREFTYELGPLAVNGQATLQAQSVQVLNRPFRWMMAVAVSTFPFTAQISDSRDQRPFSNQPVHSSNLWGTAQNPMPLLTPFRFNKNSNILGTVTDLGGGFGFAGVTNGSPTVTWVSGSLFVPGSSWVSAAITIGGVTYTVLSVGNQNTLTLSINYQGANNANIAYNVANTIRLGFKGVELDGE